MSERVLVKRMGALGDVILATPMVRWLKQDGCTVGVQTAYPDVFKGNPHVDAVNDVFAYDRLIDLDLAYERRPRMHIVEAYMEETYGPSGHVHTPERHLQQELFSQGLPTDTLNLGKPRVIVHAPVSWPSRTLPIEFWNALFAELLGMEMDVLFVGTAKDMVPDLICFQRVNDLRGKTTLQELHALISRADVFVGADSAVLHVAGATDTPIIGLFTSVKPEYRLPLRGKGHVFTVQPTELDCLGCLADVLPPATNLTCRRGDNACVAPGAFDGKEVAGYVKTIVGIRNA